MKISRSILALAFFPLSVNAGIFEYFGGLAEGLPSMSEIYTNVECSEISREAATCNLAPFTGVFVCREIWNFFGVYSSSHSVCVANVGEGITLGLENDACGCCGGECPTTCPCSCDEPDANGAYSMQLVRPVIIGSTLGPPVCVTTGASMHLRAWGGRVVCDESCLTETSEAPSVAPTVNPTVAAPTGNRL
jgi:hypothetical protein